MRRISRTPLLAAVVAAPAPAQAATPIEVWVALPGGRIEAEPGRCAIAFLPVRRGVYRISVRTGRSVRSVVLRVR